MSTLLDIFSRDFLQFGSIYNSLLASGDVCRVLITLANSLDPDQVRRSVGPGLNQNCLTR